MRKLFFITIPALLIFLVAVELCLRLAGYVYVQQHHAGADAKPANPDEFRILCLGDSFTFGVGAAPESGYPQQLEQLLRKNVSDRIRVINEGRLANTSSLLLKRLKSDLEQYTPSVVVVMIGSSNSWNLEDSSYFLLHGSGSFSQRLMQSLSGLALYKFLRIAVEKFISEPGNGDESLRPVFQAKTNKRMAETMSLGSRFYREGKHALAAEKAKEGFEIDPADYVPHLLLTQVLIAQGEYAVARRELWETIYRIKSWDVNLVYAIANLFKLIDRQDNLDLFKEYLSAREKGRQRDALVKAVEASLALSGNLKIFKDVFDYDLEQITKLAKKKKVRLVLQTYPRPLRYQVNDVIREKSRERNICLVDNEEAFKEKADSEFFVSDGHCNEKGYGVIAGNVYGALVKSEMLPKEKLPWGINAEFNK